MMNMTVGSSAFYDQLTPENAAMLLSDHQAGLFLGVHSTFGEHMGLYDFLGDIAAVKDRAAV